MHGDPFAQPPRRLWIPEAMSSPPLLDRASRAGPIEPRYALLINPFYPKDPHASFGKHVLTPTLALTSFAATTPARWRVEYWDENLLDGRPPLDPMPHVVGITVHLTFAKRAFELADGLALDVYRTTRSFPREEVFGLTAQMRRAAVSAASNRQTLTDYIRFLDMAYGSARELQRHVSLATRRGYLSAAGARPLQEKTTETTKVLNSLVRRLREKKDEATA